MLDIRFIALAAGLFVMSYAGVAWLMAGAPLASLSSDRPLHPAALPGVTAYAVPSAAFPVGDGNPERDRLRIAALQASTASAASSPCNPESRTAMIEAVSAYAGAWAEMMDCGPAGCDYKKINVTAAVFSTPLDIQLRDSVGVAFEQQGISIDDFPAPLRINVAMLVRGRAAPASACPQQRVQVMR